MLIGPASATRVVRLALFLLELDASNIDLSFNHRLLFMVSFHRAIEIYDVRFIFSWTLHWMAKWGMSSVSYTEMSIFWYQAIAPYFMNRETHQLVVFDSNKVINGVPTQRNKLQHSNSCFDGCNFIHTYRSVPRCCCFDSFRRFGAPVTTIVCFKTGEIDQVIRRVSSINLNTART